MRKEPVTGWANDEATYRLLDLLFKLGIVSTFIDARPAEFRLGGENLQFKNYRMVK